MTPPDDAPEAAPAALAWSGDGQLLAYSSQPGRIVIADRVDDETARERVVLATAQPVDALALSHDGEWLAVGGGESVALWRHDLARRQAVEVTRGTLPSPDGAAGRIELAFAPDGRSLAVGRGRQVLLLRIDADALRPAQRVSVLRIRAESQGRRRDFVLETPAGQLTDRMAAPDGLDAEQAMARLRPLLAAVDPESDGAAPAERLEAALAPLRRLLLPFGLGESKAMTATDNAVALDVDPALAGYSWELLLTGRGTAPLAATHGLVRATLPPAADVPAPQPADAPVHALFLSAGSASGRPESTLDLDESQGLRLAAALREAGAPQGLIECRWRATAAEALVALRGMPRRSQPGTSWRLVALIGTPNADGELALEGSASIGYRQLILETSRVPDVVLLIGGDFRRLAARLREAGVAVCVAAGWPMDTESLWCFFSEWLRVLRGGQPLVRAAQMARQYATTRSDGTAWALEVHGDPLWTWPEVSEWRELRAEIADSAATGDAAAAATLTPATPPPALPSEVLQAGPGDAIRVESEDGQQLVLSPQTVRETATDRPAGAPPVDWSDLVMTVLAGGARNPRASPQEAARALDELTPPRLFELDVGSAGVAGLEFLSKPPERPRLLVLVHGLMGNQATSFDLGPETLGRQPLGLGAVLAYEYPSLTWHPARAASDLLERLPHGARLHLLTHGSGCLVAEAIARALADEAAGAAPPPGDFGSFIGELARRARQKDIALRRTVRVAGPALGLGGLGTRADAALSLQAQLLDSRARELGAKADDGRQRLRTELLLAVARDREAASGLPGLATTNPADPFIGWINDGAVRAPGELYVVSGTRQGGGLFSRLGRALTEAVYRNPGDSDGLVPTASTFAGVPRGGDGRFFLHASPEVGHYRYFRDPATARAIRDALQLVRPPGFAPIGPLSRAGKSSDGSR